MKPTSRNCLFPVSEWLKFFTPWRPENFFYWIATVPSAYVNRKCVCYTVLFFYPGFLHCSEESNQLAPKVQAISLQNTCEGCVTFFSKLARWRPKNVLKMNSSTDVLQEICLRNSLHSFLKFSEQLLHQVQGLLCLTFVMWFCLLAEIGELTHLAHFQMTFHERN